MNLKRSIFLLLALAIVTSARTQSTTKTQDEFALHFNRAAAYNELSLYGPCIEELNTAIDYARAHHLEEQRINAVIMLAEIMRKTGDFDKGLELLTALEGTASYPQLHVQKLGRIAAIYNEQKPTGTINQPDSVLHYLDSALKIATTLHLTAEEAGLYNELGYTVSGKNRQLGLSYLLKAAKLFDSLHDTHNYVGAMTNVLRCYLALRDTAKAREIINELLPLTQGKHWYTAEIELYNNIAGYYKLLGDSVTAQYWNSKADKSLIEDLKSINSSQVHAFRTLYETKKLKEQVTEMEQEANLKQEALDRQTARTRELIVYLSILVLLIMGMVALLLRERKLKRQLKNANGELHISNEKYQVLMVESNHRIKNNLQMVISMLQYSENQPSNNSDAFKRMSNKIQTISALHRHLSVDVHNELVTLDVYFAAIVELYGTISSTASPIACTVAPVGIRSERIVYFGLILNEMLANTIEHRTEERGAIMIAVKESGQNYLFDYRDGSFHDPTAAKGTGSALIRQLIQRVGGSEFRFDPAHGHYQFQFYG